MKIIYASGYYDKQAKMIVDKALEETRRKGDLLKFSMVKGGKNDPDHLKEPFDIYHCHAGHSLETIPIAKELGAKVILQRDSAHAEKMLQQLEIYGGKCRQLDPKYKDMCNSAVQARQTTNLQYQLREYEAADYILVASTWERDTMIECGIPKGKIKIVPFTADSEVFKPRNLENRPFSVCLGGNQCLRKGYPYAKEACKKAGVTLNVINGFKFEEMNRELNNYSVCLAPTVEDGYPHQVLAGMLCGQIPIISTFTGTKDLIKHGKNGFIVDLEDDPVQNISEILVELQRAPEWRFEVAKKARETVAKRTWDDYSKDVHNLYKKVM